MVFQLDLFRAFGEAKVEQVLVGDVAINLHGVPVVSQRFLVNDSYAKEPKDIFHDFACHRLEP